jgi:hypothetical protein
MDMHIDSGVDSKVTQPWNKGKLTGAKPPLSPNTFGRSEHGSNY